MKVVLKGQSVDIEVEGKDIKDVFAQLASASEVFHHSTCGMCQSNNVAPVVRTHEGNTYYEMRCHDCGARLEFGQRREGGALFPKRKDKDGNWSNTGGWAKFTKQNVDFA